MGNKIPLQRIASENPMIIDNQIHGWITWKDVKIPVLQKPADLSNQGEELLTYTDGTISYPCAVIQDRQDYHKFRYFLSSRLIRYPDIWKKSGNS